METKKVFKYFTIYNHEKEEEFLREMSKAGWRFTNVSSFGMYHFEKAEPEDVVYRLDYNQEGRENKSEYVQMFSDCGWEYIQDYAEYSYFRKPAAEADGNEEIFCDDESKFEMLKRVFKGRVRLLIILFFLILIPNFIMLVLKHNYIFAVIYSLIILLYIVLFLKFIIKCIKYINITKK